MKKEIEENFQIFRIVLTFAKKRLPQMEIGERSTEAFLFAMEASTKRKTRL